jgi:division/cell wall cluster transcriptional repressor MraZ
MDPVEESQLGQPPVAPPNGRYNGKLDDKGRLKLPAVFQKFLATLPDKEVFVTSMDANTVQIYPIAAWRANLKFLREQQGENKKRAQALLFTANDLGADSEIDNQGRILLNSYLRDELKLDDQALHLSWEDGHITLFTEEIYRQRRAATRAAAAEALETLQGVGLQ